MKAKAYTVKLLITCILQCEGLSWWLQPDHKPMEVFNNPIGVSKNVALPSVAGDLPRAMDILPGHTLIRPDMESLRSAVKFPKKELEDGARVYGNIKSIGVSVGNNKRIVNTGFRRSHDVGYKVPWRTSKQVDRRNMNDENYLHFKNELIPNHRQNRPYQGQITGPLIHNDLPAYTIEYNIHSDDQMKPNGKFPPFLPESKGYAPMQEKPFYLPEEHAPTTKKPPKGLKVTNVLLYGKMVIDDENMLQSSNVFQNARKDYDNFELREHAPTFKQLSLPVRWEYIILSDDLRAKKRKVIKLLDGTSEDDDKTKGNIESSKILAEFLNTREQSPLRKDRKVLRAGVHEPKPILISGNPESEDKEKYYVPPQRLVDYLNSRDLFDHVKISDRAPTLKELVPISPPEENNIRKWWFFNQDDYKPLLN